MGLIDKSVAEQDGISVEAVDITGTNTIKMTKIKSNIL
ncbi:unnamed protein product, partial [marine sediment metagenome]